VKRRRLPFDSHYLTRLGRIQPNYSPPVVPGFASAFYTCSAGTNSKAAGYTAITTGFSADADGFYLNFIGGFLADYLVDIALGGAGSEVDILSNLLVCGRSTSFVDACEVYIPLRIPASTRVSCRAQSSDASATFTMALNPVRGGFYRAMRCTQAETLGAATGDSGGVSVDPGGSAGTKGAWAQLSAATSRRIKQMVVCVGGQNNGTRTDADHRFDIGTGASSSEVVVLGDMYSRQSSITDGFMPNYYHRFIDIPAGTRVAARQVSTITDATDRLADVVAIGFS